MNSATTSSSAAATSGGSTSSNGGILALGLFDRDRSLPQEQALERYFDIVIQSKFGHIFPTLFTNNPPLSFTPFSLCDCFDLSVFSMLDLFGNHLDFDLFFLKSFFKSF